MRIFQCSFFFFTKCSDPADDTNKSVMLIFLLLQMQLLSFNPTSRVRFASAGRNVARIGNANSWISKDIHYLTLNSIVSNRTVCQLLVPRKLPYDNCRLTFINLTLRYQSARLTCRSFNRTVSCSKRDTEVSNRIRSPPMSLFSIIEQKKSTKYFGNSSKKKYKTPLFEVNQRSTAKTTRTNIEKKNLEKSKREILESL